MPKFREAREQLLIAYDDNLISDEEFLLLYEINSSKNPDFNYWNYPKFDVDIIPEEECQAEFRFLKNDIPRLREVLQIPEEIVCFEHNDLIADGTEALCIVLNRLAYPCRYSDMIPQFGRPVPQLSIIFNKTIDIIHSEWGRLLDTMNQPWLQPPHLANFARSIHQKGAPLDNVWGFIDGTVKACCKPGQYQREVYNGHKRIHSLKYQSVTTPSGMIANLFGPIGGRRHDSALLALSGLLQQLQQFSVNPQGGILCLYGDPAYPLRQNLQAPFHGANLTIQEQAFNRAMSEVRVSVEWIFGDILNYFKFNDFKKNLKIGLSPIGKIYRVSAILSNAHTCFYKNNTSNFFDIDPPLLEEYFQ